MVTMYIKCPTFEFDLVVTEEFFQGSLQLEHGHFAGADGAHEAALEGDEGVDKLLLGDDAAGAARYAERAETAATLFDAGCENNMEWRSKVKQLLLSFDKGKRNFLMQIRSVL